MKEKVILHVDGNNFFVSCEILMNPALEGKPVCVLSNNDGCVVSRSNEAKKLGVSMGLPYFMAKDKFKNVIFLSANFTLYQEISSRFMQYLKKYSDKIDVYSIDEAFLDITGINNIFNISFPDFAKKVKEDIKKEIGINVSVGISHSKILAKLATHKAKQTNGFYFIQQKSIKDELGNIDIEEIWGIGKNTARKLKANGIFFAEQILNKDDNFFKNLLGKKGLELKYELSGTSVIPLTGVEEKPKSIQKTRAFPIFTKDKCYIKEELNFHLTNVCKKLRKYGLKTSHIGVMLRTKDFQVYFTDKTLDYYTNSELSLIKETYELFEKIYYKEIIYRSCGIIVYSLSDVCDNQLNLFQDKNKIKAGKIGNLLDKIENKFGSSFLALGENGISKIKEKHKRIIKKTPF